MQPAVKRRLVFVGGLALFAGAWQLAPRIYDELSSDFDFETLEDPVGFRKIVGADVSAPLDIFVGLESGPPRDLSAAKALVQVDFASALFPAKTKRNAVQIAYFSDFYCPYCRLLSQDLIEVSRTEHIEISWHESPIFGDPSILAAKGAIAADAQGAYVPYHDLLVSRPVVVTPDYLRRIASDLGLDMANFFGDMDADSTQAKLDVASVLFDRFQFLGTPGMVVGRTVVYGRISGTNLRQLIAREREDGHVG